MSAPYDPLGHPRSRTERLTDVDVDHGADPLPPDHPLRTVIAWTTAEAARMQRGDAEMRAAELAVALVRLAAERERREDERPRKFALDRITEMRCGT